MNRVLLLSAILSFPIVGCTPSSNPVAPPDEVTKTGGLKASNAEKPYTKIETKDLVEGKGDGAVEGDLLVVGYEGSFPGDGKVFDSNTDFDPKTPGEVQPYVYKFGDVVVIRGWAEGLKGMKAGGIREIQVPFVLGYGKEGSEFQGIAPMQDLNFKIELLYLVKKDKPNDYQSTDIVIGKGQRAGFGDSVKVNYTGTFLNGLKFDSSYDRQPVSPLGFRLGKGDVVRGWDEGIQGMNVGGKRRLILPPALAYGANGNDAIGKNQVLQFDVELVSIDPK